MTCQSQFLRLYPQVLETDILKSYSLNTSPDGLYGQLGFRFGLNLILYNWSFIWVLYKMLYWEMDIVLYCIRFLQRIIQLLLFFFPLRIVEPDLRKRPGTSIAMCFIGALMKYCSIQAFSVRGIFRHSKFYTDFLQPAGRNSPLAWIGIFATPKCPEVLTLWHNVNTPFHCFCTNHVCSFSRTVLHLSIQLAAFSSDFCCTLFWYQTFFCSEKLLVALLSILAFFPSSVSVQEPGTYIRRLSSFLLDYAHVFK